MGQKRRKTSLSKRRRSVTATSVIRFVEEKRTPIGIGKLDKSVPSQTLQSYDVSEMALGIATLQGKTRKDLEQKYAR